jgi:hypothetical protein
VPFHLDTASIALHDKALAVIRASGHVVVDAGLPVRDLVALAEAAATWGASLTLRHADRRTEDELTTIAAAGRGHVTFDLTGS